MKELYPGEHADLQRWAQSEGEALDAAQARLAATTPGTLAHAQAEIDSDACMLAAGHALWELAQFEKAQAARG